ncbi:hypothetical protein QQF64_017361 [Cirrhinus molitorella]|uniref:Cc8L18.2-like protein n=1 Tax=Cirrhinus molitorella TaxID=172907 RepID=A0ABR3LIJ8_9TELE
MDRTTLNSQTTTREEYIDSLVEKCNELTAHHFIAKHQTQYLQQLKDELEPNECIILLDFAENYSFLVQDAAQAFHWVHSQCTLHPFAIYYRNESQLKCLSMCVISDCLKHDTAAVHTFLGQVLKHVKHVIPGLEKVYYFSDGAASQYKNYKNFANLMHHKRDFNLNAEWHFFATSHGKSPCDGIGGTVKREAARASLQATVDGHILTANDLFTWADKNILGIKFIFIDQETVNANSDVLHSRFLKSSSVPGTRDSHSFKPVNDTILEVSRVSEIDVPVTSTGRCYVIKENETVDSDTFMSNFQ